MSLFDIDIASMSYFWFIEMAITEATLSEVVLHFLVNYNF